MNSTEMDKLNEISERSRYAEGVMTSAIGYCFQVLTRYLRPGTVLELGPAEGVMTEHLARTGKLLTLVEGSAAFCHSLRERFPSATVVNELFENFCPQTRFDNIVMGHVLEHVVDPEDVLRRASSWLAPGGMVFAAVPNSNSLHRQAAVIMGLLSRQDELNERDRHHGHRRVFHPDSFRKAFLSAGFDIRASGGYWLKPVSNSQIDESWSPSMVSAFLELGERYPDIAAESYIVATLGSG